MRPIFERCAATHTVFAIDLPGFGFSDRSDRAYTPRVMTDALHSVAREVQRRCGDAPIDALALSLGCEFLARAAMEQPSRWGRLALVSPTGLDRRAARTVNKERAQHGESVEASTSSLNDLAAGRRGGLRSHSGPGGRTLMKQTRGVLCRDCG